MKRNVLVPLVKDFLSSDDVYHFRGESEFVRDLLTKTMAREKTRGTIFSPSALGSKCLRVPYLSKNSQLVTKKMPPTIKQQVMFLTGNFIHLKLALLFYNIERWIDDPAVFKIYDFELSLLSKHGDFGGTIDMVCQVSGVPYIVDFKGLNSYHAEQVGRGRVSPRYRSQISAYGILWNTQRNRPFEIRQGIIFVEDKGADDNEWPLSEAVLPLRTKVALTRLRKLREYEEAEKVPPPACHSLQDKQFRQCPFRLYCWDDVKAVEKEHTRNTRSLLAEQEKEPTTEARVREILKKGRK